MTIYVKHFTDQNGDRMSEECFDRLCKSCDFDPDLVLEVASDFGWSYHPGSLEAGVLQSQLSQTPKE